MKINSSERKVNIEYEYSGMVKGAAGFGFQRTSDSRSVSSAAGYSPSHGSTHKISHAAARRLARLTALALALMMIFTATLVSAATVDTSKICSMTVHYKNSVVIPGANVFIYRVASVDSNGNYTLTSDFEASRVDLSNLADASASRMADLAETLSAYAAAESVKITANGKTDADGYVTFEGLQTGLYLVTGTKTVINGVAYTPSAMLVSLPQTGEDGNPDYSPTVNLKDASGSPEDEYIDVTIYKIWKNEDETAERPESVDVEITMELLRDGESYDKVTLSEANSWQYTWENLESKYNWQVYESDSPSGYTVLVDKETGSLGLEFTVTNTYDVEEETPTPEATPTVTDTPTPEATPTVTDTPKKLPQTGQLNWPIPLLSIGGLLMILAGLYIKRRKN